MTNWITQSCIASIFAITTKEGGTDSLFYDNFGRLTVDSHYGVSTEYEYNLADARTNMKVTKGYGNVLMEQSYEYNNLNQLEKVYNGSVADKNLIAAYTYDANGNTTEVSNGNGTKRVYAYENAHSPNLLTKVSNQKSNGEILSSYAYSYYADGNIAAVSEQSGEQSRSVGYSYDRQGRLKTETDSLIGNKSYTYDNYGNRSSMTAGGITTTYGYNANNQLLTESRTEAGKTLITEYAYDPNGNMVSKQGGEYSSGSAGEETLEADALGIGNMDVTELESGIYEYDSFNQLTKVTNNGTVSTYTYRGNGLRDSKTVNGETIRQIWAEIT